MTAHAASPRIYGVIGDPVAHSRSPFIFNRAFHATGVDARYEAFHVERGGVPAALERLRVDGIAGLNVTYPHKEVVAACATSSSDAVRAIGAANHLTFTGDRIHADNTDGAGVALALTEIAGATIAGRRVAIMGGGGSARAAAHGLLTAGAETVTFLVRDVGRVNESTNALRALFPDRLRALAWTNANMAETVGDCSVVVNATPLGMAGVDDTRMVGIDDTGAVGIDGTGMVGIGDAGADGVDDAGMVEIDGANGRNDPAIKEPVAHLNSTHVFFDFVYTPLATPYLRAARSAGARTLDGVAMLVAQAAVGFERWTGLQFSVRDMYDALIAELKRTEQT